MTCDYDKLYGETRNALGQPSPVFVDFFDQFDQPKARILDVGCGQGRDALFIARLGHSVVGVDISSNGIHDLNAAAMKDDLAIEGVIAEVSDYKPEGTFDVVLADRTLHMLPKLARLSVLQRLLDHVNENGWVLIADEKSNIKDFVAIISKNRFDWTTHLAKQGYLFVQRA
ncbi:MAG: class I SAM-dependent methyltransferase [Rhodobacteraceae bacterium]|nr:class I SAM-dependent methyltransferase [Paracoccaceae bacterium]